MMRKRHGLRDTELSWASPGIGIAQEQDLLGRLLGSLASSSPLERASHPANPRPVISPA